MNSSGIEWTDSTVNPLRARNKLTGAVGHYCEHVSPGCNNCYAEAWNARTRNNIGTSLPYHRNSLEHVELFVDQRTLNDVLQTLRSKKHRRIFWCSMTDIAATFYTDEQRDQCFDVMDATTHLTHQVLTKRPTFLRDYFHKRYGRGPVPEHIWIGTTVEDQRRADERIPILRSIPATVRFLSCEPLLEDVELDLRGIGWVIPGGESGSGSRECDIDWIRSIVNQCKEAGVACFVKQLGDYATQQSELIHLGRKGKDIMRFPDDLQVREFPSEDGNQSRIF